MELVEADELRGRANDVSNCCFEGTTLTEYDADRPEYCAIGRELGIGGGTVCEISFIIAGDDAVCE